MKITLNITQKNGHWLLRIKGPDVDGEASTAKVGSVRMAATKLIRTALAAVAGEPVPPTNTLSLADRVSLNIRDALDADGRGHAAIAAAMYPASTPEAAARRLRKFVSVTATSRQWPDPEDFEQLERVLELDAGEFFRSWE